MSAASHPHPGPLPLAGEGGARVTLSRDAGEGRGEGAALAIEQLEAGYEPGLPIVRGASLAVAPGEMLAVLGPNGAGKSTLVKAACGLVPVFAGRVLLGGRDVTRVPAHRMVFEGLAFVPQTENVFANLGVTENLELAAALVAPGSRADRHERVAAVRAMFPDLARQGGLLAGRLSGGQRQMLAVARALIARPRVLVLDEPSAGLSPKLVGQVLAELRRVRDTGVAVVLVEQNVKAALAVADRAAVLVEGKERVVAPCAELLADQRMRELYLGRHASALTPALSREREREEGASPSPAERERAGVRVPR